MKGDQLPAGRSEGTYSLHLVIPHDGQPGLDTVDVGLRDNQMRQIGRTSLPLQDVARRYSLSAYGPKAKKWAYYQLYDPLELLAREAESWGDD